jgi:hypothetical protein
MSASGRFRAQAAMEFMVTYGWAILILAIVFVGLVSFGLFGQFSYAPRAQAGSCYMYRPFGPYSVKLIALEGICQGELPQYVAKFDGVNSQIPISKAITFSNQVSLSAWVYYASDTGASEYIYGSSAIGPFVVSGSHNIEVDFHWQDSTATYYNSNTITPGSWHSLIVTYDGSNIRSWVDGIASTVTPVTETFGAGIPEAIGSAWWSGVDTFSGRIANVQIYNSSLSANEVNVLYVAGIGGTPVRLQNLVAWWPLNGDATDYSENGNNGNVLTVSYMKDWTNGYTAP